jgi:ATP-dependent RNA helicase DHX8/PRP22
LQPRARKRLSSPERFELKQLIASGVLDASDLAAIAEDDELNATAPIEDTEEELDIEVCEEEPAFLRGQTRKALELSPIKIIKAPDGTLNRAAIQGAIHAKERRELKQQQAQAELEAAMHDLSAPWHDPMPDPGARHFAQDARGMVAAKQSGGPEWKKSVFGLTTTFGKITDMSIKEQRESLPIFKLREPLIRAIREVSENTFIC